MGYLLVDDRVSGGKRHEFDTISCRHCQKVIKIYVRGCTREVDSKYRCRKCHGPICKVCAAYMERDGGECAEPFMAKVDQAMKTGKWREHWKYRYHGF